MPGVRVAAATIAVFAAAAALAPSCATTDPGCAECATASCCDGRCVDLDRDVHNCGFCGNQCGEGRCSSGVCLCGEMTCAPGETCCADACTRLSVDIENCGACGNACDPGVGCRGGECGGPACPGGCAEGYECCGSACVRLETDSLNCGRCGRSCGPGGRCVAGECVTTSCSPPCDESGPRPDCCGEVCTNFLTDPDNCGLCGNRCEMPLADRCMESGGVGRCSCAGRPACGVGQQCCSDGCRSVAVDSVNCGECGHRCATGESCRDGVCGCGLTGAPCPDGWTCCRGECIDTQNDDTNCGACGTVCTGTSDHCVAGVCACGSGPACRPGFAFCTPPSGGERCCGGACVPLDESNCSACGDVCAPGATCFGFYPGCACVGG